MSSHDVTFYTIREFTTELEYASAGNSVYDLKVSLDGYLV